MNIHITPRTIYLTRHGESLHNVVGKIGGNSELSPTGQRYAGLLSEYINDKNIPGYFIFKMFYRILSLINLTTFQTTNIYHSN